MRLQNVRIGVRLTIGFAFLGILLLIQGAFALYSMNSMHKITEAIDKVTIPSLEHLAALNLNVMRMRVFTLRLLIARAEVSMGRPLPLDEAGRDALCAMADGDGRADRREKAAQAAADALVARLQKGESLATIAAAEGLPVGEKKRRVGAAVPFGRFGTADEVAGIAVFLASDEAAYITAQTYGVDGGNWMA